MSQCKDYDVKKEIGHIKIPLHGVVDICCSKEFVIYDGKCIESFGTITFENEGCCQVEIYKNNLKEPVNVIEPGGSFTLASNSFWLIAVKCKEACYYNEHKQCKKHYPPRYKSTCSRNRCDMDYDWGKYECYAVSKKPYRCHKCTLCYNGVVYVKVNETC